jgi:predicted homoserine dehydrogenase-like protein
MALKEIQLGIIGAGAMGKGLLYQSLITPGIRCAALCDLKMERCASALEEFGIPYEFVDSPDALESAVRRKVTAVCTSGLWLAECAGLDAVMEATSDIGGAAEHCLRTLEQKKHLILMNSEIDLMFGPLLHHEALKNGVVCTSCDGDQYGVLKNLIDEIRLWGFELVMAGNIKGFLDRYATPESIVAEADKRNLDYRMCTSYTDGTKLNIEMAILANTFGLTASQPGMAGPQADHVNQVFDRFDFPNLWKNRQPVVDYILGAEPGGGVFVIGYCENPYQRNMLAYYKMGNGPFYLFYRPCHLCHIEGMQAVFEAVNQGRCFLAPDAGMRTNVFCCAKRDLPAGTVLDGIGGFHCYGPIDSAETDGLPIGLSEGTVLNRSISKDERISMKDISYDPTRLDFQLYARTREISP